MKGLLSVLIFLDTIISVLAIPTGIVLGILTTTESETLPQATAMPRIHATAWSEEIPLSTFIEEKRQANSTTVSVSPSSSPTSSVKLGQLVVGGTRLSTLPPAICGFLPFNNGTGPDLG